MSDPASTPGHGPPLVALGRQPPGTGDAESPPGPGGPRERADAARNRRRVLSAAERLFAERGVEAVTMDDIAAAAGVGKGTLYRRYPSRGALAFALLDDRERDLQQRLMSGPPPLGPGAPPADRLAAFVHAYAGFLERALDLVATAEAGPGARTGSGAYAFWHSHCAYLLAEAGAADPDVRSGMLLASLSADQYRAWLERDRPDRDALHGALANAARALACVPTPAPQAAAAPP